MGSPKLDLEIGGRSLIARALFPRLRGRKRADRKKLLQRLGPRLVLVPFYRARLMDVDTPADYAQARRGAGPV